MWKYFRIGNVRWENNPNVGKQYNGVWKWW